MILLEDKELYLFELDDVLFPRRDYILQVYYLFAQFVDFTEGNGLALKMVDFMKETYDSAGEEGMIQKVAEEFKLSKDYTENFARLEANAHLPAKLFLFDDVRAAVEGLVEKGKKIGILTKGNPVQQLNKMRHIDWQGLDRQIKVYFTEELVFRNLDPILYIAQDFGVEADDVLYTEQVAR